MSRKEIQEPDVIYLDEEQDEISGQDVNDEEDDGYDVEYDEYSEDEYDEEYDEYDEEHSEYSEDEYDEEYDEEDDEEDEESREELKIEDEEENDSEEELEDDIVYYDENFEDETPKKPNKKRRKQQTAFSWKKCAAASGVVIGVLALLYVGISVYFMSHFFVNTTIEGYDFSAKSVLDVEQFWEEYVAEYVLTLKENDGDTEEIKAAEIGLVYQENDSIEKALKEQNAFLWPTAFFKDTELETVIDVSYDEEKLKDRIASLNCLKKEQIPSVSAYPKYNGEKFVPEPEVVGTAVDLENLDQKIKDSVKSLTRQLDMKEEKCYADPRYTADSPEVEKACEDMNQYLRASITYQVGTDVILDKDIISTWLSVDEEMNVIFSEDAVRAWLAEFGDTYDTYDKARHFMSPWGKYVEVQPGRADWGAYGWSVDEGAEFNAILETIWKGETVVREPIYLNGQRAAVHEDPDWGGTYLEVDITEQHMWYIKDGMIAFECDVVTGLPTQARKTPDGVYRVLEKCTDYTMVGNIVPETGEPEYISHVDYWMRVTWGGVGFHDATWQPYFGGTLYKTNGSHGCINMSYGSIQQLYPMVEVGTPIVVHY